jgi:hypothetical protein
MYPLQLQTQETLSALKRATATMGRRMDLYGAHSYFVKEPLCTHCDQGKAFCTTLVLYRECFKYLRRPLSFIHADRVNFIFEVSNGKFYNGMSAVLAVKRVSSARL